LSKNLFAKFLFAENSNLGVSMARSFAGSSELKAAIDNLSDGLSTSIVGFGFLSLMLRNHERYNSGQHLLDKVCDCAAFYRGLFRPEWE
jgi:hypothetical protein